MSRLFGWSYPPGCSGPPENDGPCEVCGEVLDNCICPECPICLDYGDPYCYENHGLIRTQEQIDSKAASDKKIDEEIAAVNAFWNRIQARYQEEEY